jgi:hypothetical protein
MTAAARTGASSLLEMPRRFAVGGFGDGSHVGLQVDHDAKSGANHLVVVYDEDSGHMVWGRGNGGDDFGSETGRRPDIVTPKRLQPFAHACQSEAALARSLEIEAAPAAL